jgi:hypothetical protein
MILRLWWQPIGMSVHGTAVLGMKLLGLLALAACLVEPACEQASLTNATAEATPQDVDRQAIAA